MKLWAKQYSPKSQSDTCDWLSTNSDPFVGILIYIIEKVVPPASVAKIDCHNEIMKFNVSISEKSVCCCDTYLCECWNELFKFL